MGEEGTCRLHHFHYLKGCTIEKLSFKGRIRNATDTVERPWGNDLVFELPKQASLASKTIKQIYIQVGQKGDKAVLEGHVEFKGALEKKDAEPLTRSFGNLASATAALLEVSAVAVDRLLKKQLAYFLQHFLACQTAQRDF